MELKLDIDQKLVRYILGDKQGEGLQELTREISGLRISSIVVQGETTSYTFLRQVSLLVNLIVTAQRSSIVLESKSFLAKKGLLVPIYEN